MPISALPTPPSRSDAPQDFSDRADALLGALPGFVTEANALQSDVNAKEASASSYATIATDKAAEAQGHATTASTKASEAAAYAAAAAAAASNAEIAFDSFDDKYLGSKAGDPTTDNDGNPLLTGALYWNTSVGAVRVWNGSAWLSMAADASIVDFQQAGAGAVVRTAQEKLREWVSVNDFGSLAQALTYASDNNKIVQLAENTTIRIPTDCATLQAAIDHTTPASQNVQITLNIEAGHAITSGVIVEHGDFSQYAITSTDATILLDAGWVAGTALLTGTDAKMPNWNIFVDCGGKDVNAAIDTGAISVLENSELLLGDGAGCTNGAPGNNGIVLYRNSKATGNACVFTNFSNNIWITHGSVGYFERVTATGAGLYGIFVSRSSVGYASGGDFSSAASYGAAVWRSRLTAIPAGSTPSKFNNCGIAGVFADTCGFVSMAQRSGIRPQVYGSPTGILATGASTVDARGVDFQSIGEIAVKAAASNVIVDDAIFASVVNDVIQASDCAVVSAANIAAGGAAGRNVIRATQGASVTAPGANMNNAGGDAVYATSGARVNVTGCSAVLAGLNAFFADAAEIVANDSTATGAASRGALAQRGAYINVNSSNLSGATVGGLRAVTGSRINGNSCNAQAGSTPATTDVQVQTGSIISFNSGTGGVNADVNTITASGIIFR